MPSPRPVILFDTPDTTYYPGDTVSGTIVLKNTKPLEAYSVVIKWSGICEARINLLRPAVRKNVFIDSKLVWVPENGEELMPAGTHKFPFSFVLPKECCPPSYKDSRAKNVYKVEVLIERPWKFDIKAEKEFKVSHYSENPSYYRSSEEKMFRAGWIFNDGPITIKILERKAVNQPGETIDIPVTIINNSFTTVKTIYATLYKKTEYNYGYHRSKQKHIIKQFPHSFCPGYIGKLVRIDANVASFSEKTFNISFTIPENEATTPNFDNRFVRFGYFVNVRFRVNNSIPWQNFDIDVRIGEKKKDVLRYLGRYYDHKLATWVILMTYC